MSMGIFKQSLSQIETRLQKLIEGSLGWLFPGPLSSVDLVNSFIAAMQAGLSQDPNGVTWAPNLYLIKMHPNEVGIFLDNQHLVNELTQMIEESAAETGFVIPGKVLLTFEAEPTLAPGEFKVKAIDSQQALPQTSVLELIQPDSWKDLPESAFLIVDGTQTFLLTKPVVNIGRRADNDLVIEDQRVSRLHAQLRWVRGKFILFDLESSGGTFVNNVPIKQVPLQPGDVVSLAGVPVVFGLESQAADHTRDYQPQDIG